MKAFSPPWSMDLFGPLHMWANCFGRKKERNNQFPWLFWYGLLNRRDCAQPKSRWTDEYKEEMNTRIGRIKSWRLYKFGSWSWAPKLTWFYYLAGDSSIMHDLFFKVNNLVEIVSCLYRELSLMLIGCVSLHNSY